MPQFDQTGPAGGGPGSGRGMGSCGAGTRRGAGCCGRRRFISPKNELAALEEEEKSLEKELETVREEKAAVQSKEK